MGTWMAWLSTGVVTGELAPLCLNFVLFGSLGAFRVLFWVFALFPFSANKKLLKPSERFSVDNHASSKLGIIQMLI